MEWHGILYYSIYRRERERGRMTINGMEWIKMEEELGNIIVQQYHIELYCIIPESDNVSFEMRKC